MMYRLFANAVLAAFCLAVAVAARAQTDEPASPPAASIAPAQPPDDGNLSAELFYHLLLADVALQRGDLKVSARAYLDAARSTNDARIANRATEVAIASRDRALVQEAAELWTHLDPAAERPKRVLAALAADKGDGIPGSVATDDLRSRIERVLADAAVSGRGVGEVFLQLNRLFSQQSDKRAVLALVRDLAKPYPKAPEAQYAVALAAFDVGAEDAASSAEAREAIDQALALRPEWDRAAILKGEILAREGPAAATQWLEAFVAAHPDS